MSNIHTGAARVGLVLWAVYIMFAQPGLPACWLEAVPCAFHVHFGHGHAEAPHSHAYLIDISQGQGSQPYPHPAADSMLLVLLLALSGATARLKQARHVYCPAGWAFAPEPPPPRFPLSA